MSLVLSFLFSACLWCCYLAEEDPWSLPSGLEFEPEIYEVLQRVPPNLPFQSPDNYPKTPEWLRRAGLKSEEHNITTEDGYLLTMFRISGHRITKKKPILVVAGTGGCSDMMVALGNESIGIILASEGYDVWLGNPRGTAYGRSHIRLSPKRKKFWNFSLHKMGYYDIPAMMERVLSTTESKRMSYLCHSGGCAMFLVMASTRPEYDAKISAAVLLAPVGGSLGYLRNTWMGHFLRRLSLDFTKKAGVHEFDPRKSGLCSSSPRVCLLFVRLGAAGDISHWKNLERVINITNFGSSGASVKALDHFRQIFATGRLARYDYGAAKNLIHYGINVPPMYDLTKIKAPVALFIGKTDRSSDLDVARNLTSKLKNVIEMVVVGNKKFNHADFIVGENIREAYFLEVVRVLDSRDNA